MTELGSNGMTAEDTRIALRTWPEGRLVFVIVDHPEQPADYVHADGTIWAWHQRWHLIGGTPAPDGVGMVGRVRLRAYDLVTPGTEET
jgi:light-regulated signal transduction histidine kinase (bacteriophytochrome)